MISHTGQYGIRALVYLSAVGTDAHVPSAAVAAATGLPPNYLTKILNTLVHAGVLESTRGPNGGFRLSVLPGELSLSDAIAPFEEADAGRCLLGPDCCGNGADCSCRECRTLSHAVHRFLETTTIADLAGCGGEEHVSTAAGK
jgi:Rrf2 family protein